MVKPIWRSTPRSKIGPRSEDKPPPAKSARTLCAGMDAKRSCSGVEFMPGEICSCCKLCFRDNSHFINHLRHSCPFLCKIRARSLRGRSSSAETGGEKSHSPPISRSVATATDLKSGRELGSFPTRFASTPSAAQTPSPASPGPNTGRARSAARNSR